jgi:tRNA-2-methylthio-N6-dimethylallyladenosine synthase
MNEYDSEIVRSILKKDDYSFTNDLDEAEIIFLNTCAIRENAHAKIYGRLGEFKHLKRKNRDLIIGLLGCMSQNLRGRLDRNEDLVDIYAGPDSYKRLPAMLRAVMDNGHTEYDFSLSEFEDYSDVYPKRIPGINAWIAVMRGCDNFCTFCVVPYTRGRERSRSPQNIVDEANRLAQEGFKQVTLLGQNVNSYRSEESDFADLIKQVSEVHGIERVRFTSPHPKDFPERLLNIMAERPNVCKHIHLPLQAGSDRILALMNRTYTKEDFMKLVDKIRNMLPEVTLTTDAIVGFSSESDSEFEETVAVMRQVEFDAAFIFKYSERINTIAHKKYADDVAAEKKTARIVKLNALQKEISLKKNLQNIGRSHKILVEGSSKKDQNQWMGRTDGNKIAVFPNHNFKAGELISVTITDATANTLIGTLSDLPV